MAGHVSIDASSARAPAWIGRALLRGLDGGGDLKVRHSDSGARSSQPWIAAPIHAVMRPISPFSVFMLYCEGEFGYQAGARRHAVAFFGGETAAWRPNGPPP
jgi:hypothetical protein